MRVAVCIMLTVGLTAPGWPASAQDWTAVEVPNSAVVLDAGIEDGIVWLSTRDDGLIGYDGGAWVLHRSADGGMRSDRYNYSILVDSAGEKWVGRDGSNTVDRLDDAGTYSDKTDDSWSYYSCDDELVNCRVFSMAEDREGNKWFGMRDEAHVALNMTVELLVESADTMTWYHYDTNQDSTAFRDDDVRALAVDRAGRLWIGYYARGVDIWDYGDPALFADDSWTYYAKYQGLPDNSVSELHVSDDGRVWVGTLAGLAVYDPSSDSIGIVEGLSETKINAIDSDAQGHIWVATDHGVVMLYGSGAVALTYDDSDGIRDAAVSEIMVDRERGVVWAVSVEEATLRAVLNRLATPYGADVDTIFVYPNPLRSGGQFRVATIVGVPDGSTVEIFDVTGEKVLELGPGEGPYVWDTLDSSSIEVPSGVYVVRMETPGGHVTFTKVAIIR